MTRINYSKLREEISVFLKDKVQPQWRLPMTQKLVEIVKECEVKITNKTKGARNE